MKRFIVSTIALMISAGAWVNAASLDVSYNVSKSTGDVEINHAYFSSRNAYKFTVYGVNASDLDMQNEFVSDTNDSVSASTNLNFVSNSGYINATEKVGSVGAAATTDNIIGENTGEFTNAAVGVGVKNSNVVAMSTTSSASNGSIGFNITKLQGKGEADIGALSHSYKYVSSTNANCPFAKDSRKISGSDIYSVYSHKLIGNYDYTAKIRINK